MMFDVLPCIGRALVKNGLKALANCVPLGSVLYEIARDSFDEWREHRQEAERRSEVEALAQAASAEVKRQVALVVQECAADQPPAIQQVLNVYLTLVPATIRQSLRRPADPSGTTAPPGLALNKPADLLPLLPAQLPRFQPGDRPLPGVDWELVELLGRGGFGEVWLARHTDFDGVPPVALKFCLDPTARDRLLRHEAAVLNQVMRQGKHAGIVTLQHTYLRADPPCLEYEYVAGGTLAGLIQEGQAQGGVPLATSLQVMQQLAETLAFAHRLTPPIVHRDLKPANILVERAADGELRLKIADFGIGGLAATQVIEEVSRQGTNHRRFLASAVRGAYTPLYASPQQMRGQDADPRDDVHALGVIWYQLLTADLTGGAPSGRLWPKRLLERGLCDAVVDLLATCLEPRAEDRLGSAIPLVEQLARLTQAQQPSEAGTARPSLAAAVFVSESPVPGPVAKPGLAGEAELPPLLTNSIGMKLALIASGRFFMGSRDTEPQRQAREGPRHEVMIAKPFYLGIYPVTQREYEAVMKVNPAHFKEALGGGPDHPVEQVAWADAAAFCRRLSASLKESRARRLYRLPTEAEWEYGCRAGASSPFHVGASISTKEANFGNSLKRTTKVGSYPGNAFGLHDMHGNVWEWCEDIWHESYPGAPADGSAWRTSGEQSRRVLRGGSWFSGEQFCRSAYRDGYALGDRSSCIGFRVVLSCR